MIEKILGLYKKNKSIILYLVFGVLTTVINIVAYTIFTKIFNIDYIISNIISWIVAVTFAFFTNKIYVFESKTNVIKEKIKEFILFYWYRILSLLLETILLYIFVGMLHINDLIMKIITNIIVIILNYVISKYLVFKRNI